MPRLEKICTGTAFCSTFNSTMRVFQFAGLQPRLHLLAACADGVRFPRCLPDPSWSDVGQQQIEQPFGDALLGLGLDELALLLADHADGDLGQIADHALDIAADGSRLRCIWSPRS